MFGTYIFMHYFWLNQPLEMSFHKLTSIYVNGPYWCSLKNLTPCNFDEVLKTKRHKTLIMHRL